MTTITKERLLTIKQWRETYGPGSNVVLPAEEAEELARIALASLEAKPIGAFHIAEQQVDGASDYLKDGEWPIDNGIIEVYAAPPVPVVPEEKPMPNPLKMYAVDAVAAIAEVRGWNACRAAMLQSQGNCIKDGWISCSERMPEKGQNVLISVNFDSSLVEPLICSARYTGSTFRRGDATIKPGNGIEQATHWMPLPEPPQEVKRG
ncbi:DUF551 domain-containing protein [Escherichia coli]|uniref:DUF551 domain-containing protein n=1 Tax=Escherichia coli TaxID=562 RepID=A0A8S7U007_ECOLX|nr:DUF551 domain-containing protein [Escherichia coli]AEJ55395.1 hypothetical protein UMNF18_777 [Escherichia coli UMNF18]EEQ2013999.1 DUF551 domain-containing protein [Escherichia coli]EEQ2328199.1 DUF551 domain-containing protein [Escherichia coli]EEQ2659395.1 DUF551 domain-containing protein [Escherichia coli]EEQ2796190.1 DUF551 domain-containing protein [Escherichia coli]